VSWPDPTVERFGRTERAYHWAQAVPYLVCLGTGAAMLLLADGAHQGERGTAATAHRVAAVVMCAALLVVVLAGDRRVLLENLRIALRWRGADLRWLLSWPLAELGLPVTPPPVGKFNPGQKLNLLAQTLLLPVFAVTGTVMWLAPGVLGAWFIHTAAFVVAAPLVTGHLYLAVLHRSTRRGLRGVLDGHVDRAWAAHHYPLWLAEEDARSAAREREALLLAEVRARSGASAP